MFGPHLAWAAILKVGPKGSFAKPSEAIARAAPGDLIQIASDGDYLNDVAIIHTSNLTIEGVGNRRAVMKTDGRVYGRKGIWVFAEGAANLTLRNLQFEGARVLDADGANGAGIRAQGKNLSVDNCRFTNNQDGILGGMGTTTIEHSEFDHNGLTDLTHNLYIGDQAGTLIFRYNYSHDSKIGHLLKSRAATNVIEYNRLSDDDGTGSYELDLPNGGACRIIGNLIQQSAGSQNGTILSYGEEGIVNPASELNLVNNTFINDRSSGVFVQATKLAPAVKLTILNNIFAGPGTVLEGVAARSAGNLSTAVARAGFANSAQFDFRLLPTSPAIGIGVDPGNDAAGASLVPTEQYKHPCQSGMRSAKAKRDAGAFGVANSE
jgi:hypothetical protein